MFLMKFKTGCKSLAGIFILLFFIEKTANAQSEWCATMDVHRQQLSDNPALAEKYFRFRQSLEESLSASGNKQGRAVVMVPVVVHVVHDGDPVGIEENITDAQILSQIDVLNEDFRRLNSDATNTPAPFLLVAADFEIEFCMAQRDPNGLPTNGINRFNGGRSIWNVNQVEQFKPSTIWNPAHYLNIWVLRLGGTSSGTLGYAQFPGLADSTDGIVIDFKAFGTIGDVLPNYSLGRTTTHEVGHWLGLFHTWGDGDCSVDDGISDTPLQGAANFGCPTFPSISCNNGPEGDMFMNYMDYTNDACSNIFTQGQKTVADMVMAGARQSIRNSMGCVPTTINERDVALTELIFPTEEICTDNFIPVIEVMNLGSATIYSLTVNYQIDNGALSQFTWNGYIPTYDFEYIKLPLLNLSLATHTLYIFVSSPNGGNDQNPGNEGADITFTINSIGIGNPLPVHTDFETAALPQAWQILNPNNDRTWSFTTNAGAEGSSASALFDNFSAGGPNPRGRRDGLITPEFDFRFANLPYINFNYAYARRNANTNDSLILYYSLDCGFSWRRIWAKGGAELATAAEQNTAFVPQATEWENIDLEIHRLTDHWKVKFMLENYSDFGNNLYIDDFKIRLTPESVTDINNEISLFSVFPNPSSGKLNLQVELPSTADFKLELFDLSGKIISVLPVNHVQQWSGNIDLSGTANGVYLLRLSSNQTTIHKKIVLN